MELELLLLESPEVYYNIITGLHKVLCKTKYILIH